MNDYKKLNVWEDSIELTIDIYKTTEQFPQKEIYGLCSQINRAAVSVAANISEGAGRNTAKDFNHFLSIAYGSLCELETLLIISQRLNFISQPKFDVISIKINKIQKMIYNLQKSLLPESK